MKFGDGLLIWSAVPLQRVVSCAAVAVFAVPPERGKIAESLQLETLRVLEWPAVCRQLSVFTSTSMGRNAVESGSIPLGGSPDESRRLLQQTSAAVAITRPLNFSGIEDVSSIVDAAVLGDVLSIGELCSVRRTLGSVRTLIEQLEEIASEPSLHERCCTLLQILQKCDLPIELEQKIEFCIDCSLSTILDRASEELELIRLERKTNLENLESLLKHDATRIFNAGGIDRPIITKRRSRMCVAVRTTHRSLLPGGVVLDSSNSGATYFMEPREAVDFNNQEVKLSEAEKMEEQVVLSLLSGEIAKSVSKIKYLLDRVLDVDLAFARAGHARWIQGVCPNITYGGNQNSGPDSLSVDVKDVRHPLLLASSPSSLVPVDFKINVGVKVVVISGPNTGGKTASLKTLGLISVMLKAGMYLPASNQPRLPWFDLVLADIGDNQSLEQSLSTFSGHMSRICNILKVASKNSLVLLDEIGSGTDPSEGVALSTGILQYIKDRVNLAAVTTHYADLTRLKEEGAEFENAAMEFSQVSLEPTYRIIWGSMGESNALNIATTIGFDREVIEGARSWVQKLRPENMQKLNTLLYHSLFKERNALEAKAVRAASLRSEILQLYNEIKTEADQLGVREAALNAELAKELQQELKLAKTEIDAAVNEFEKQLRNSDPDDFNKLLKDAESAIALVLENHLPSAELRTDRTAHSGFVPQIGDQVLANGLGNKLATVLETPADDNTVLVQCGKIRLRVNLNSLKPRHLSSQAQVIRRRRNPTPAFETEKLGDSSSYGPVVRTSKNSLDLRGMRAEEAKLQVDMAIATRESCSVLFIVHGTGTGVLKELVLELLRKHPRVAKFEPESPTNYGCTVAYIK